MLLPLRKSLALALWLMCCAVMALVLTRSTEWTHDWGFVLAVASGTSTLLSPLAAAAVVAVLVLGIPEQAREVVGVLPRRQHPGLQAAGMVWGLAMAAWLPALAVASAVCAGSGAETSGATLPSQLVTGPAAVLAGAVTGAALGSALPWLWTIPATLVAIFLSGQPFFYMGYPELLTTEIATAAVIGARPIPEHLLATVVVNLLRALAAVAVHVVVVSRGRRPYWFLGVAVAAIAGTVVVFAPFVIEGRIDTYELLR